MSETLWELLCTVEVPDSLTAAAVQARKNLRAAWASVPPESRAALEQKLAAAGPPAAGESAGEVLSAVLALAPAAPELYQAAVGVRGLTILSMTVARTAGKLGAAQAGGALRAHPRPGGAARLDQAAWGGEPLTYEDCGPQWYLAVSQELGA